MPLLYNAYEAEFLNVLHSKLIKKKKSLHCLLSDQLIQVLHFLKENWSIFKGDLPTHTQPCLFSGATCPHTHACLFSQVTYPFDCVNLRSHLAISFNPKQSRCVAWST